MPGKYSQYAPPEPEFSGGLPAAVGSGLLGALGSGLEGLGWLSQYTPGRYLGVPQGLESLGGGLKSGGEFLRESISEDQRDNYLYSDVAPGLGSLLSFAIPGAGVGGLAARGAGALGAGVRGAQVARKLGQFGYAGSMAGGAGVDEQLGRVRQYIHENPELGLTEDDFNGRIASGGIAGLVQIANLGKFIDPIIPKKARGIVLSDILRRGAEAGVSEAAVESGGALIQNALERSYNMDRDLLDNVAQQGGTGGLVGTLGAFAMLPLTGRGGRARITPDEVNNRLREGTPPEALLQSVIYDLDPAKLSESANRGDFRVNLEALDFQPGMPIERLPTGIPQIEPDFDAPIRGLLESASPEFSAGFEAAGQQMAQIGLDVDQTAAPQPQVALPVEMTPEAPVLPEQQAAPQQAPPEAPQEGLILKSNGQPYFSEQSARRSMTQRGIEGEVTPVEGGFAIRRQERPPDVVPETAEPIETPSPEGVSRIRGMQDIRAPSENLQTVIDSNFESGRVVGDETVPVSDLAGGVTHEVTDQRRVQELADQISSPEGYFERIIVDQDNNVIEGAHRIEAARQLGIDEVPVTRVADSRAGYPIEQMREAILGVRKMRSDNVNQVVDNAIEAIEEAGGVDQALSDMQFPRGFEDVYRAAIEATRTTEAQSESGVSRPEEGVVQSEDERATGQVSLEHGPESNFGRVRNAGIQVGRGDSAVQGDLFLNRQTVPGAEQRNDVARRVGAAQVGTFRSGIERVESPADAAHVVAPLRKKAQEHFGFLVTDKDGRPIAFKRQNVGKIDSTQVEPRALGELYNIPEAAEVWMVHNHPSGHAEQSSGDAHHNQRFARVIADTGLNYRGSVVVAPGGKYTFSRPPGGTGQSITFPPGVVPAARRTAEVPVEEREVRGQITDGPALTAPATMRNYIRDEYDGRSGVLFLDGRHSPVGFMDMEPGEFKKLRTGDKSTGFGRLASSAEGLNAAAAVVVSQSPDAEIGNVDAALTNIGIRSLDGFVMENGYLSSMGEGGKWVGSTKEPRPFYRLGETTPEWQDRADDVWQNLRLELDKMRLQDVKLRIPDEITSPEGTKAAGRYFGRAIDVALNAQDPTSTLNHEAIHAIRDLGLFDGDQGQREWRSMERRVNRERMADLERRYGKENLTREELLEEGVADMYAEWRRGDFEPKGLTQRAMQRIKNFFESLGNALRGNGFQSAEDVFGRIESGEAGDRVRRPETRRRPRFSRDSDWGGRVTPPDNTFESAAQALIDRGDGYVEGALSHPQISGAIDLVWGREGTPERNFDDGFGLAKIIRKHPEIDPTQIQDLLYDSQVVPAPREERRNRIKLESEGHQFVISQEWRGDRARWLLTAYSKEGEAPPGRSVFVAGRTDPEHPSGQEASSVAPQGRIVGVAEGTASERPSGQEAADTATVPPDTDAGQTRYSLTADAPPEIQQAAEDVTLTDILGNVLTRRLERAGGVDSGNESDPNVQNAILRARRYLSDDQGIEVTDAEALDFLRRIVTPEVAAETGETVVEGEETTDLGPPESPSRRGPPETEGRRAAQERLERNLNRLHALHDQVSDKKRVLLGEDLKTEITDIVEGVLTERRVRSLTDSAVKATTHLQARKLVERAQAMVNNELSRRAVAELQNTYKKAMKAKVRPEFLEKIKGITEGIDLKTMGPGTKRALRKTAEFLGNHPDNPMPPETLKQLARLDKQQLRDMNYAEIQGLTDAIQAAAHLSRIKNKLLGKQKGKERGQLAREIVKDAKDRVKPLKQRKRAGAELSPRRSGWGKWLKEMATTPQVLAERISPKLKDLIWEDVTIQAHENESARVIEFRDGLRDVIDSAGQKFGTQKFEKWRKEQLTLDTPDGAAQLTRDEAIWLLTTVRDPTNLKNILRNGVTLDRSDRTFRVDDQTIENLRNITGDAEQAMSDYMFDQFNGNMKQYLNDAWVEVYGHEIARVQEYVPRSIDMSRTYTGKDPMEAMGQERKVTVESWGNLRDRVQAPGGPLRIGSAMDTFMNHSEHVARVSAYLSPVHNVNAILGRPSVKRTIIERVGREGYMRLLDSVADQTTKTQDKNDFERGLRNRLRLFGASTLGLRVSTLMLNPSGLFISSTYQDNGFKNLSRSITSGLNPREWKRIANLAKKFSPYWTERYSSFAHQVTSGLASEKSRSYGRPDIAEYGLMPLQKSDQFGGVIRWRMAELEVSKKQPDLVEGSDAFNKEVALEWKRLMFLGENSGHGGDRTGILSLARKNPAVGMFVMFTSSVSKIYSAGMRGTFQAQQGDYRAAAKTFAGVVGATAWAAMVREIIRSVKGQGDDEEIPERIALRMATEAGGYVPVIGQAIVAPSIRKMAGKPGPTFSANIADDVLASAARTLGDTVKAIETGLNEELDAKGEKVFGRHLKRAFGGWAELSANWFGVPYGGPKDMKKMFDGFIGSGDSDVRSELRALSQTEDVTQERRRIIRAIRENDSKLFRQAATDYRKAGRDLTPREITGIINRMYGDVSKYEFGKPDRILLTPRQMQYVDEMLSERDQMRQLMNMLVYENSDVFYVPVGRMAA